MLRRRSQAERPAGVDQLPRRGGRVGGRAAQRRPRAGVAELVARPEGLVSSRGRSPGRSGRPAADPRLVDRDPRGGRARLPSGNRALQLRLSPVETDARSAEPLPAAAAPARCRLSRRAQPAPGAAVPPSRRGGRRGGRVADRPRRHARSAGRRPRLPPARRPRASRHRRSRPSTATVVRIAGDGEFAYSTFRLENPDRFVIDLAGRRQPQRARRPLRSAATWSSACAWPSSSRRRSRCRAWSSTSSDAVVPAIERTARRPAGRRFGDGAGARSPSRRVADGPARPPSRRAAVDSRPAAAPAPSGPSSLRTSPRRPGAGIERRAEVAAGAGRRSPPRPRRGRPVAAEHVAARRGRRRRRRRRADGRAGGRRACQTRSSAQPLGERASRSTSASRSSFNLTDADIKDVLRTFAQICGLNIVVQPGVARHGHRRARERAVGPGAGADPQDQRPRLRARGQRHAHRAALDAAARRREEEQQLRAGAGALGPAAHRDQAHQLRRRRQIAASPAPRRSRSRRQPVSSAARHRRRTHQHADHQGAAGLHGHRDRGDRERSTRPSRRS